MSENNPTQTAVVPPSQGKPDHLTSVSHELRVFPPPKAFSTHAHISSLASYRKLYRESIAHPRFKQAFIRAEARDATLSVQLDPRFPVIPVRAISNAGTRRFMDIQREVIDKVDAGLLDQKAAQLEIEHFWAGALRRAVIDGDVENGSLMAGQSVGLVREEQTVAEILAELIGQAEASLERRCEARR